MPTITRCRIASDIDYLSKLQLGEVSSRLKEHYPKLAIEMVLPGGGKAGANATIVPNSPERVALLMKQLLDDEFDALVLNATNLPARLPTGLTIGAITERLTPYDVLVSATDCLLDELPENAAIAANDVRRQAQLLYFRPDLKMVRTKGSVDSVIQKVKVAS